VLVPEVHLLSRLLEHGANLITRNERGETSLFRLAVEASCSNKGYVSRTAQMLLDSEVDPDIADKDGLTPLGRAIENTGKELVTRLLRSEKVNQETRDRHGRTALANACGFLRRITADKSKGNHIIVKLLLDNRFVDPESKDNNGWTTLFHSIKSGMSYYPEYHPDETLLTMLSSARATQTART
jgi:ankyrin repeat protein